MKPKMASLLRGLSERFIPSSAATDPAATQNCKDGFLTAKGTDALFARTNPEIDGEDCLHDCESCTVNLPRKWEIDEEDKLYGNVKGWSRHLLVATGKSDWVRDVADEKGSVMEAVGKHDGAVEGGKLMLSASNIPVPDHTGSEGPYGADRPTTVLLLPLFQWVDGVTPNHVPALIKGIVNTAPTNTTPFPSRSNGAANGKTNGTATTSDAAQSLSSLHISPKDLPDGLSLRNCSHKCLILLCSQGTRDARCGQSAPLLRRELERQLRPLGLYRDLNDERPGGVGIYFISHVGGHKYSANMMVYRRGETRRTVKEQIADGTSDGPEIAEVNGKHIVEGESEAAQCIWLARIRPEDCENVVKYTVLQGKVVKPDRQLRGEYPTFPMLDA